MAEFYPDIHDYLETLQNSKSVSGVGLEDIINKVKAKTGFSHEICTDIVKLFFQEIRNAMLRGDVISLRGFGKLYIHSPKLGGSKKIFPKFKPYNKLLKKINEK